MISILPVLYDPQDIFQKIMLGGALLALFLILLEVLLRKLVLKTGIYDLKLARHIGKISARLVLLAHLLMAFVILFQIFRLGRPAIAGIMGWFFYKYNRHRFGRHVFDIMASFCGIISFIRIMLGA